MQKIYFFILGYTFFFIGCKKEDDVYSVGNPSGVPLADIIKITSVSKLTLEADSLTFSTIEVMINPEASSSNRKVAFTTTNGVFLNGKTTDSVIVNSSGVARVSLLSSKAGVAIVAAKISSYTRDTVINFTASLPDDMLMSASKYVLDTTESFTVTNKLFRNPGKGKVTDPVKVFYEVTPEIINTGSLIYSQFAFSANRETSISISNPFKLKGRFIVTSKTVSASGNSDTLKRSFIIEIK